MSEMLIDYYKAIEDSSAKMLEAAKMEDWDGVVRFEGACAVLIEQLRHRARSEQLSPNSRAEKNRIMRRILHNDAQIRYLAEPWLAHFEQKFDGHNTQLH
ncbi:flagellar protein FliT [Rhodoferax aquaticus]|jgi:flagellar protein FliT|uniref:Flagellar protein FliT n=1 Tax=Rhodoferax aquaticus TaxID=2527691 RepID=A0A515ETT5_9BURK|nr:flagellar protein FliT [Rhodoferax aquaticus]QDL56090.1 flagellar protein FliT [Rhodoferax aquaticus]